MSFVMYSAAFQTVLLDAVCLKSKQVLSQRKFNYLIHIMVNRFDSIWDSIKFIHRFDSNQIKIYDEFIRLSYHGSADSTMIRIDSPFMN